jgi:hypothetical protein
VYADGNKTSDSVHGIKLKLKDAAFRHTRISSSFFDTIPMSVWLKSANLFPF